MLNRLGDLDIFCGDHRCRWQPHANFTGEIGARENGYSVTELRSKLFGNNLGHALSGLDLDAFAEAQYQRGLPEVVLDDMEIVPHRLRGHGKDGNLRHLQSFCWRRGSPQRLREGYGGEMSGILPVAVQPGCFLLGPSPEDHLHPPGGEHHCHRRAPGGGADDNNPPHLCSLFISSRRSVPARSLPILSRC